MPIENWSLIDHIWTADVLLLVGPGDNYSGLLFWDGTNRSFSSWYVNLQTPFERTPLGIDFVDHFLTLGDALGLSVATDG